jgi:hypothetical protein
MQTKVHNFKLVRKMLSLSLSLSLAAFLTCYVCIEIMQTNVLNFKLVIKMLSISFFLSKTSLFFSLLSLSYSV